jgi:hypothetical protein
MIAIISGGLTFIAMHFFGGSPGNSDLFQDNWSLSEVQLLSNGNGLQLTLRNSLTDDWDSFFDESVTDWNVSPALSLSTDINKRGDDRCSHLNGIMRVCNGEYGRDIGWQGVNEVLFYEGKN